ncbi:hypothetical protein J2S74_002896 [Evansella vedderi]|uniref:Uncharacterized protein n=1 Tax=Evansella vedderi TaxID=38282 RepID=A0ABT9ZWB6_9BACI|nr:hypothetical protein [Evansella vedderi]
MTFKKGITKGGFNISIFSNDAKDIRDVQTLRTSEKWNSRNNF